MNIGREIITTLLKNSDTRGLQSLLDSGFTLNWLDTMSSSQVIFTGIDRSAYRWLLNYYKRHHVVPDIEMFRQHYPEETLPINGSNISVNELIELAEEKVNSFLVADVISKAIDHHDKGNIAKAVALLGIKDGIRYQKSRADDLSSGQFNLDKLLNTELEMGIRFGIDEIDEEFFGFQPGMLITLMGRQKSGKSWSTINSALNAWKEGYTVLVFSVEMDTRLLWERVLCLGSNVSPSRMRRGRLLEHEKQKVRDFESQLTEESGRFLISKKRGGITVDTIREEIAQYNPNIVYIDGMSFMIDSKTGRMTSDWQANENVAADLKELAMEEEIVIFVNTQVQEKQYSAKHGIEAKSISSGTGLLKASDLVLGQDKDKDQITINAVYSRFEYPSTVVLEIDWETMKMVSVRSRLEGMGV